MAVAPSVKELYLSNPELKNHFLKGILNTGRTLGLGAFGKVIELQMVGTRCAGKQIHDILLGTDYLGAASIVNKFVEECRLMAKVKHPNIVQFMGICLLESSDHPLLVMEYLDMSLDHFLQARQGHIPLSLKYRILLDIDRGLLYLHSHDPVIIHRDLTSRNILLNKASLQAKIVDLGNALMTDPAKLMNTLSKMPGTALYMPPEASGTKPVYNSSLDMFSFGHLSLYVAIEEFPQDLPPSTYMDPITEKIEGFSEVQRREKYLRILHEMEGLKRDHPFCKMITSCLHNLPNKRPSAQQALYVLEDQVCAQEDPYATLEGACKLDLVELAHNRTTEDPVYSKSTLHSSGLHVYDLLNGIPRLMDIYRRQNRVIGFGAPVMRWKQYVFKIEDNNLKYYKSNKPNKIIGEVNLQRVTSVSIVESDDLQRFPFLVCFEPEPTKTKSSTSSSSSWQLATYTTEERSSWMEAIKPGSVPSTAIDHDFHARKDSELASPNEKCRAYEIVDITSDPNHSVHNTDSNEPTKDSSKAENPYEPIDSYKLTPSLVRHQTHSLKNVNKRSTSMPNLSHNQLVTKSIKVREGDQPSVDNPNQSVLTEEYDDVLAIRSTIRKPVSTSEQQTDDKDNEYVTIEEVMRSQCDSSLDLSTFDQPPVSPVTVQATSCTYPSKTMTQQPTDRFNTSPNLIQLEEASSSTCPSAIQQPTTSKSPHSNFTENVVGVTTSSRFPIFKNVSGHIQDFGENENDTEEAIFDYENLPDDLEQHCRTNVVDPTKVEQKSKPPVPIPRTKLPHKTQERAHTKELFHEDFDSIHKQSGDIMAEMLTTSADDDAIYIRRPGWAKAATNVSFKESQSDSLRPTLFIPRSRVQGLKQIGQGHYGQVFKAEYNKETGTGQTITVAVKTLKKYQSQKAHDDFLKEMGIMAQFAHPNVIKLFGLVQQDSPWIILEYLENGDLRTFLQRNKRPVEKLINYMLDIALGMHYIAEKGLVHRMKVQVDKSQYSTVGRSSCLVHVQWMKDQPRTDIAARNIILNSYEVCKISDFGLLRELPKDDSIYVSQQAGPVPIRWMAPESLLRREFSPASDVWSYGILLWELRNPSERPYSQFQTNIECAAQVIQGFRLSIPQDYPEKVQKIMTACWQKMPAKRPSFLLISRIINS